MWIRGDRDYGNPFRTGSPDAEAYLITIALSLSEVLAFPGSLSAITVNDTHLGQLLKSGAVLDRREKSGT